MTAPNLPGVGTDFGPWALPANAGNGVTGGLSQFASWSQSDWEEFIEQLWNSKLTPLGEPLAVIRELVHAVTSALTGDFGPFFDLLGELPILGDVDFDGLLAALRGDYTGGDLALSAIQQVAAGFRSVLSGGPLINLGQLTAAPVNLLPSGSFDTDSTVLEGEGWSWDDAVGRSSAGSARFVGTGEPGILFSPAPAEVEAGKPYTARVWVSWSGVVAGGPALSPFVRWSNAAGAHVADSALPVVSSPPGSSSWVELAAEVTAPAGARWGHLAFQVESGVLGSVWWDDAAILSAQTSLPQAIIAGLSSALESLGEDVADALDWLKNLIEKLTGRVRSTIEDAIDDAVTFAQQLGTILSGGAVGTPLPTLVGSVIGSNQTILNQIGDILGGVIVTPVNPLVQGVKDWFTGLGSWQTSTTAGVSSAQSAAEQIAQNVQNALEDGAAVGAGVIGGVFDHIADLLGLARTARDIALTAQNQLQEITNDTQAPPELNGTVWSTTFGGSDNSALPSGDWSPVSGLVIKAGHAGIADGSAVGHHYATSVAEYATDSQSASIVLGPPRGKNGWDTLTTGVYVRANAAFTSAAYAHVKPGTITLGRMTRSGGTFTWTGLTSVSTSVKEGDLVRLRVHGDTYHVVVNGIARLSFTDSAAVIPSGASYRRAGFSQQRGQFSDLFSSWTNDSWRVAGFALSDWLPTGVNVTVPAWRLRRGSGGEVALAVDHGAQAPMPSGFYNTSDLAAGGVSVTDLGTGQVTIPADGWYEISAASTNRENHSSTTGTERGNTTLMWRASPWVLYVDGVAVIGPIPAGSPTTLYLAASQVVRPGISASAPLTMGVYGGSNATNTAGRSAVSHVSGSPSASFVGRKVG